MPSPDKLAAFVTAVRESGLIPAREIEALTQAAAAPDADAEAIVRDLVARGLLTRYQARMLWKGRGAELFLNQYLLLDKLGEGAMGEVFRARHRRMGRDVALKVMRRDRLANPEAVRRFRREIQACAALAHDNIIMAYDADQSGDVHFFAMEFVDGVTLERLVQSKGPLPVDEACDYIRQAALGLQHAHEKGLVHRDIKPSNLLLDGNGIVKISDLGLVLIDDPNAEASRITREGLTVGTPDFLAPEQARHPRAADIRADIYSLGCTFYYLLTGSVPYPGGTPTEKMLRHARAEFPQPERPDVPREVRAILAKMTRRRPDQRFQTPAEVADALAPHARRKSLSVSSATWQIVDTSPLTSDDLPASPTAPDSRFALPASALQPSLPKRGCLGVLLFGIGLTALGTMLWRLMV